MPKGPTPLPPEDRFWRYVDKQPACWLWTGGTNGRYGLFSIRRDKGWGKVYAHRFSYELHRGQIPPGLVINHLCSVPLCVRPDHLEVATYRENSRYGSGPAARRAAQTHCKRGHPLDGENLIVRENGTRHCRECNRLTAREYMRRKRSARQ